MSSIFISHSSGDNAAALELKRRLEEHNHSSVFLDFDPEQGIPAGRDWEQELYQRLRACRAVLVLCSRQSMESRWCFAEIVHAKALGKHIFPIRLDDCEVHPQLSSRQVLDLRSDERAYDRLWLALESIGLDATFSWNRSRPPYPGLVPLQAEDAAVFFGRDPEIRRGLGVLERLRRFGGPRAFLILGASGAGKSSLLRAGLLPRLERNAEDWLVIPPMRPSDDPWRALAIATSERFKTAGVDRDWRAIRGELSRGLVTDRGGEAVVELMHDLRASAGAPNATVLLPVDQLEELLEVGEDDREGTRFLPALHHALTRESSPLVAVCTLRSDLLGGLQNHPSGRDFEFADLPVGPMSIESLLQIIEGPAQKVDLELEAGLAEALVADAETRDALPLLAFTLRELYERFGGDGKLSLREYREEMGGLGGSIAGVAETLLTEARLDPQQTQDAREAFIALARVDEEGRFVKRSAGLHDFAPGIRPLIQRFEEQRLLTREGSDEDPRVEVAHEALFRSWDRLRGWLDRSREFLLWRHRLRTLLEQWNRSDRDRAALLRGSVLEEAGGWLAQSPRSLTEDESRYIRRSQREAAKSKRRKYALLAAAGLFLSAMAIVGLSLWRLAEQQRAEARDAAIVNAAGEWLTRDPTRAALLLLEVGDPVRTRLATAKMRKALGSGLYTLELAGHSERVSHLAWSPHGDFVATASWDGSARLWALNADNSEPRILGGHRANVTLVEVSPDARRVLTLTENGRLRVWRSDGKGDPLTLGERRDEVAWAGFGPTSQRVVTTLQDGRAQVWDLQAPAEPLTLSVPDEALVSVSFSPKGDRVLGVTDSGRIAFFGPDWTAALEPVALVQQPVDFAAISPHGDRLVTADDEGTSCLVFLDQPNPMCSSSGIPPATTIASLTATGDLLASISKEGVLRVQRLEDGGGYVELAGGDQTVTIPIAFDRAGTRLAAASISGAILVWELITGEYSELQLAGENGAATALSFDHSGRRLAVGFDNGNTRVWRTDSPTASVVLRGHQQAVIDVAFGPHGRQVLSASLDDSARVWPADGVGQPTVLEGHRDDLTLATFSHNEAKILTASVDGTARLWNANGSGEATVLEGHDGIVETASFDSLSEHVVTGSSGGQIKLWKSDGTAEDRDLRGHERLVMHASFASGRSELLLTAAMGGKAIVWDLVQRRQLIAHEHDEGVTAAAFDPAGRRVITGTRSGAAYLWNIDGSAERTSLTGHTKEIVAVGFDRSGARALTASKDGTVRIWNTASPKRAGTAAETTPAPLLVLSGSNEALTAAVWSHDGEMVATTSNDGTARVWTTDGTGSDPIVLRGHDQRVTDADFSPDGRFLVTGSEDETVRVWALRARDLRNAISETVQACLDPGFRQTWLLENEERSFEEYEACTQALREHR